MAAAELAVERLPSIQCPEPAPNAHVYSDVNSVDSREVAPGKVSEPALPLDTRVIRLGKVSPDLLTVPALPYTVRATGYSATCLPPPVVKASGLVAADAAGGNFTHQPKSRIQVAGSPASYLQAALTPPAKPLVQTKTLSRPASLDGCFRCLASDHLVKDCRDPVRCRRCRSSRHRSWQCKMPFKRLLHAASRRLPPSVRRFASAGAARRDASTAHVPPTPPVSPSRYSSCSVAANATALERRGDVLPSDPDLDMLLLEAALAAFAPEGMVASASTPATALEDEHVGSTAGGSPSATVFTDKFVIEHPVAEARSPLPPPQPAATLVARGVDATNRYSTSSGEEYVSGELSADGDNSSSDGSPWQSHRARHADACVSPGRQ